MRSKLETLILNALTLIGVCATATVALAAPDYIWSSANGFASPTNCNVVTLPQPRFTIINRKGNVVPLSHGIIQLQLASDLATPMTKIANTEYQMLDSYWQPEGTNGLDLSFDCPAANGIPARNYLIFDVYARAKISAVARVGVSAEDAGLLASQPTYGPQDAAKAITGQATVATGSLRIAYGPAATPPPVAVPVPTPPVRPTPTPGTGAPGSSTEIVCTGTSGISVYDDALTKVIFMVKNLEVAKQVQSFDSKDDKRVKDGHTYVFVQFPARSGANTGWIDEDYIQSESECKYAKPEPPQNPTQNPPPTSGSGFESASFPMVSRPVASYRDGQRMFGAERDGGKRIHAACDLYRPNGEAVLAIGPGTVLRNKYLFYQGVYALEVLHSGGFVVRYGEVLGRNAPGITAGKAVKQGQVVGYVGTVNSGCCAPMMHFELFSGKVTGPLSQPWKHGFERRSDLVNPTEYLSRWEDAKFGAHY